MAISDQGERVDSYQVLDGTRPEVVVMMVVDSGSECAHCSRDVPMEC